MAARRALGDGLWGVAEGRARKAEADAGLRDEARSVRLEALAGAGRVVELRKVLDGWGGEREEYRYWRAWAAAKEGRADTARRSLTAKFEDAKYGRLAARLLARVEADSGNREAAEREYRRADGLLAGDAAARAENAAEWAEFLEGCGERKAALEALEKSGALAAEGAAGDGARLLAGILNARAGDGAAAEKLFEGLLAGGEKTGAGTFAAAACELAKLKWAAGDRAGAVAAAEKGYARAKAVEARLRAGLDLGFYLFADAKRRDEGKRLIAELVRKHPGRAEVRTAQLKFADALLQSGDAEAAEGEYALLLQTYPEHALDLHVAEGRGWAAMARGRHAESAGLFARAAQLATNAADRARCTFKQGDATTAAGRHAEAAEIYGQAGTLAAGDAAFAELAKFRRAEALARAGKKEEAAELFLELFRGCGARAPAAALRAAALESAAGRLERAIAIYDRLLGEAKEVISAVDDDPAAEAERRKRLEERRKRLERMPKLTAAERGEAYAGRGKAHYGAYRFGEAQSDFAEVAKLDPGRADEMGFLSALCLYGAGKDAEAIAAARKLLETPGDTKLKAEVRLWAAKYDYGRREYALARDGFLAYATNAHATAGRRIEALGRAARSAAALGDYAGVVEYAAQATTNAAAQRALAQKTEETPYAAEALTLQGEALLELARFDEAALVLDRVRHAPAPQEILRRAAILKADCLFAMGADDDRRYRQALEEYRGALRDEALTASQRLAISFKAARTLEKLRRYEEAADEYYVNVVMAYCDGVQARSWFDGEARAFFARAVFILADHYETGGENRQAIRVLKHLVGSGIQSAGDAAKRIERLKKKGAEE